MYDEERDTIIDIGVADLAEMMSVATYSCGDLKEASQGNVTIIVGDNKFPLYATLLQNETYIESQLLNNLPDILNTEVCYL